MSVTAALRLRLVFAALLAVGVGFVGSSTVEARSTTRWCEGWGTETPVCHSVCLMNEVCCIPELGGC